MVANKSLLVEHCPVPAEEAVLGRAGHQPVVVLDRQADVEDLSWKIKFRLDICQKITRLDFQAKILHQSISPNFNSFSDKNTKK